MDQQAGMELTDDNVDQVGLQGGCLSNTLWHLSLVGLGFQPCRWGLAFQPTQGWVTWRCQYVHQISVCFGQLAPWAEAPNMLHVAGTVAYARCEFPGF